MRRGPVAAPPPVMQRLRRALAAVSTLALTAAALGLVAITVIIGWQIFGRYVLNDTPVWSERLTIFLMTWFILLAAAAGVREGFHIGLTLLRDSLPRRAARLAGGLADLCVGGFGLALAWHGWALAQRTATHIIPTLGISTWWSYLPFVVSGLLIALFSLERLVGPAAPAGR